MESRKTKPRNQILRSVGTNIPHQSTRPSVEKKYGALGAGIKVSAPGKLILLGEHSVVYHRPCLVSTVSWRLKLSLEKIEKRIFKIETGDKKGFVKTAVENFSRIYSLNFGVKIKKENGLEFNYGLGSSAAVTVSALEGLAELAKIKLSKKELFNLAYQTVLDVQGVGSGFDVAAAIYGGTIYFKTAGEIIEPLTDQALPVVVAYSGVKADTPTIVRQVAEKKKKQPQVINQIFNEITQLVEKGKKALLKKDWPRLGQLMNANQKLLEKLSVSTPKLEKMISAAKSAGAFGAKLSGAGAGDCMIALVEEKNKQAIEKSIEKSGGEIVPIQVGTRQGVKVE